MQVSLRSLKICLCHLFWVAWGSRDLDLYNSRKVWAVLASSKRRLHNFRLWTQLWVSFSSWRWQWCDELWGFSLMTPKLRGVMPPYTCGRTFLWTRCLSDPKINLKPFSEISLVMVPRKHMSDATWTGTAGEYHTKAGSATWFWRQPRTSAMFFLLIWTTAKQKFGEGIWLKPKWCFVRALKENPLHCTQFSLKPFYNTHPKTAWFTNPSKKEVYIQGGPEARHLVSGLAQSLSKN